MREEKIVLSQSSWKFSARWWRSHISCVKCEVNLSRISYQIIPHQLRKYLIILDILMVKPFTKKIFSQCSSFHIHYDREDFISKFSSVRERQMNHRRRGAAHSHGGSWIEKILWKMSWISKTIYLQVKELSTWGWKMTLIRKCWDSFVFYVVCWASETSGFQHLTHLREIFRLLMRSRTLMWCGKWKQ